MEKILLLKMERMQKQMIELARLKGIDHPEVLLMSQKIDVVHNRINRLAHLTSKQHKPYPIIRRLNKNNFVKESSKISAYLYAAGI